MPSYFKKIIGSFRSRRLPWRVRIGLCFLKGFAKNPRKALHYGKGITVEMGTLMRFNLHIHGRDFVRDFLEESTKLGIKPFFLWGTLLGCIRENGFIDHDGDLDFGILEADYPKKDMLIKAMLKRGYRLRHDMPYQFSFELKDQLLNLDIDVLYRHQDMLVNCIPLENGALLANRFPQEAFNELKTIEFGGIPCVWVPGNPEVVLDATYGNWRVTQKDYHYTTGPTSKISDPKSLGIGPGNLPWSEFKIN